MNRFTILLLFCCSVAFGQETTDRLSPGVQLSSVFSYDGDHGINPAFSLNYRRWMFTVGPRFTYDRMFGKKSSFYQHDNQCMVDASFRYYFLPESNKVRPFAQLGAAYRYSRYTYEKDYRVNESYTYGPIFNHDFQGSWDTKTHAVSIFAGAGIDVTIWKQLSVFASAGASTTITKSRLAITNTENGTTEYSEKTQQNGRIGWIAVIGIGYRF